VDSVGSCHPKEIEIVLLNALFGNAAPFQLVPPRGLGDESQKRKGPPPCCFTCPFSRVQMQSPDAIQPFLVTRPSMFNQVTPSWVTFQFRRSSILPKLAFLSHSTLTTLFPAFSVTLCFLREYVHHELIYRPWRKGSSNFGRKVVLPYFRFSGVLHLTIEARGIASSPIPLGNLLPGTAMTFSRIFLLPGQAEVAFC